jgi:hypothetical protein
MGIVEITTGAGAVVKLHTKLLYSGSASESAIPVVSVAVYAVLEARMLVGLKVAVVPEHVIVPMTAVPPGPMTVNADGVTVEQSSVSPKVTVSD